MSKLTTIQIAELNDQFKQQINVLTDLKAVGVIGIGMNFDSREISCVINPKFPKERIIEILESTLNNLKNGN